MTAAARVPAVARALLGTGLAAGAVAAWMVLPFGETLLAFVERIRGTGAWGVIAFAVAYVLATVLLVPGAVLTLGAGLAYGPLWGTLLVVPVSVIAATAAFLAARFLARDRVARRIAGHDRFESIDRAVGASGLRIVTLLRLSPILPFNLLNYGLGVTSVGLRDYVVGSFVGMIPGTVLYVYLGSAVTNASEILHGGGAEATPARRIAYWGGLAATVAASVVLARIAGRALDSALVDEERARRDPEALP